MLISTITKDRNGSRWKSLKAISKKFASESTVIGLTRIVRAETKPMKICWVFITLVSIAFGLYLTSGTIKEYLEYDVFTQTKIIQALSSLMPSLTFCIWGFDNKNLSTFFDKAEFSAPRGSKANLSGEQFSDGIFGECVKFNHFRSNNDVNFFSANTLSDKFHFKIDLNRKFSQVNLFLSDNYNNIIDWSQYITSSYNVKGSYLVDVKKEVELKLEEPYNPCQNVSDVTYRQSNCLVQCRNRNFVSRHNCTLKNFYSILGYSFCNEGVSKSSEFESDCGYECPKECTTTKFNVLLNNPDMGSNLNDTVEFHIWYLDLSYTEIKQTAKMSGFSLLNEIGGALGLFVGISFLSLFELLEFLLEICLAFYMD